MPNKELTKLSLSTFWIVAKTKRWASSPWSTSSPGIIGVNNIIIGVVEQSVDALSLLDVPDHRQAVALSPLPPAALSSWRPQDGLDDR